MEKFSIDVCCATKDGVEDWWLDQLKYVPHNKLIISKDRPLSTARKKLIEESKADLILFIDDDVVISPNVNISKYLDYFKDEKIGAVAIFESLLLGNDKMQKEINAFRCSRPIYELKEGERGTTCFTFIRRSLVSDWNPIPIWAFEDYLLTKHIQSKGYKWLCVPSSEIFNIRSFGKTWSANFRDFSAFKKLFNGRTQGMTLLRIFGRIIMFSANAVIPLISIKKKIPLGRRASLYIAFTNLIGFIALITARRRW